MQLFVFKIVISLSILWCPVQCNGGSALILQLFHQNVQQNETVSISKSVPTCCCKNCRLKAKASPTSYQNNESDKFDHQKSRSEPFGSQEQNCYCTHCFCQGAIFSKNEDFNLQLSQEMKRLSLDIICCLISYKHLLQHAVSFYPSDHSIPINGQYVPIYCENSCWLL